MRPESENFTKHFIGSNYGFLSRLKSKDFLFLDYYWPWEKLTDVHTKPRGMNEPLQYSEMMKLAIARGYQVGSDQSHLNHTHLSTSNFTLNKTQLLKEYLLPYRMEFESIINPMMSCIEPGIDWFLIFITLPLIPSRFMKNTVQQRLLREEVVM